MKTDLFQSCGHCWVFQIWWHIECSTFTASSFRIWNSSTGIPSPPLSLLLHLQCLYYCPANRFISTIFRFHIYVLIYDICFSLSDFLHSLWQCKFIHLTRTDWIHFFLWLSNIPLFMYHSFFIHSSVYGHLLMGCFHVLAIVNSATVNMGTYVFWIMIFLSVYAPLWDWWIHLVVLFLAF